MLPSIKRIDEAKEKVSCTSDQRYNSSVIEQKGEKDDDLSKKEQQMLWSQKQQFFQGSHGKQLKCIK